MFSQNNDMSASVLPVALHVKYHLLSKAMLLVLRALCHYSGERSIFYLPQDYSIVPIT